MGHIDQIKDEHEHKCGNLVVVRRPGQPGRPIQVIAIGNSDKNRQDNKDTVLGEIRLIHDRDDGLGLGPALFEVDHEEQDVPDVLVEDVGDCDVGQGD